MFALVHNPGLELKVFEPDTKILYTKRELEGVTLLPEPKFVRRVKLEALGCTSLRQELDAADAAFEEVSDLCEASVVNHTWGLYRPPGPMLQDNSPLLPTGHLLVAEIDTIRTVTPPTYDQTLNICRASKAYIKGTTGPKWNECYAFQFVNGTIETNGTQLYMVDIDPVLN